MPRCIARSELRQAVRSKGKAADSAAFFALQSCYWQIRDWGRPIYSHLPPIKPPLTRTGGSIRRSRGDTVRPVHQYERIWACRLFRSAISGIFRRRQPGYQALGRLGQPGGAGDCPHGWGVVRRANVAKPAGCLADRARCCRTICAGLAKPSAKRSKVFSPARTGAGSCATRPLARKAEEALHKLISSADYSEATLCQVAGRNHQPGQARGDPARAKADRQIFELLDAGATPATARSCRSMLSAAR